MLRKSSGNGKYPYYNPPQKSLTPLGKHTPRSLPSFSGNKRANITSMERTAAKGAKRVAQETRRK